MSAVSQMVLYENDALVTSYSDGAGLQLAPCSSCFAYSHAPGDSTHALHGRDRVQQRCEFVTSVYKDRVQRALAFRNLHAERPYLCRHLLDTKLCTKLHADICDIAWPETLIHTEHNVQSDGSITIKSCDQLASFTLDPSRQQFKVEFMCHMSQQQRKTTKSEKIDKTSSDVNGQNNDSNPEQRVGRLMQYCVKSRDQESTAAIVNEGLWDYAKVTQSFSVLNCPDNWKQPLTLASQAAQSQRAVKFESTNQNEVEIHIQNGENHKNGVESPLNKGESHDISLAKLGKSETSHNCLYSTVPKALALNCTSAHLHKWCDDALWESEEKFGESSLENGRIKMLYTRGVTYRFIWSHPRTMEIDPGDGTALRSSGLSGHFFNHYYLSNGKVEENMYSVDRPPPDVPGAPYSLARVLGTAARLLRHLYDDETSYPVTCCWRVQPRLQQVATPLPTVLLEECVVPGVGRFTAHSSGRVRIVFADRTALDMWADFSDRLGICRQHSDASVQHAPDIRTYQPRSSRSRAASRGMSGDVPEGVAKLLLPNGHYHHVIISQPGLYLKYVRAAKEWVAWVNSSPDQRQGFYKDTAHDPEKAEDIQRELRKINCFNYIIENTLLSDFDSKSADRNDSTLKTQHVERDTCEPISPQLPHPTLTNSYDTSSYTNASSLPLMSTRVDNVINDLPSRSAFEATSNYFPSTIVGDDTTYRSNTDCGPINMPRMPREKVSSGMSQTVTGSKFEYAQSGTGYGNMSAASSEVNFDLVQEVLRRTSQTVNDLDEYLGKV